MIKQVAYDWGFQSIACHMALVGISTNEEKWGYWFYVLKQISKSMHRKEKITLVVPYLTSQQPS